MTKTKNKLIELIASAVLILILLSMIARVANLFKDISEDDAISDSIDSGGSGEGGSGGDGSGGSSDSNGSGNETPGNTENPDNPGEPGEPDNPSEPDVPDDPDNPGEPNEPDEPDDPDDPDVPEEPEEPETCKHLWGDWITLYESSCYEKGEKERSCELCRDKQREYLPLAQHSFGEDNICDVCGYEFCQHVVEEWFIKYDSTCELDGIEYGYCSKCGAYIEKLLECKGHQYGADNICTECKHKKPNEGANESGIDDSRVWNETDENGVNFDRHEIDMDYVYEGGFATIGNCYVYSQGLNFPIELVLNGTTLATVRITVTFSYPVSEGAIIKSIDGQPYTPVSISEDGYEATFEFEVDTTVCYQYILIISGVAIEVYPAARVQELIIDCYY